MKSKVLTTAWEIFKLGFQNTFAKALKLAWKLIKMNYGIPQQITYAKESGELREAKVLQISTLSTIDRGFIKYVEEINGAYLWRSFRIDRIAI